MIHYILLNQTELTNEMIVKVRELVSAVIECTISISLQDSSREALHTYEAFQKDIYSRSKVNQRQRDSYQDIDILGIVQ